MPILAALLVLVIPLVKKILLALGLGVISYIGVSIIVEQLTSKITGLLGELPSGMYQIFALAGGVDAIGIMLGGLVTVAGLSIFKKFGFL